MAREDERTTELERERFNHAESYRMAQEEIDRLRDAHDEADIAWQDMRGQVATLQEEMASLVASHEAETARLATEHAQQSDSFAEALEAGRLEVELLRQQHEEAQMQLEATHKGHLADQARAYDQALAKRDGDLESALTHAVEVRIQEGFFVHALIPREKIPVSNVHVQAQPYLRMRGRCHGLC